MTSCNSANLWKIYGGFEASEDSKHIRVPLPWRYLSRRDCRSRCVLCCLSHFSNPCVDCTNAAACPTSGHHAMCLQVSVHSRQLGQSGFLSSWCAKKIIVLAMPSTCLAGQTWKSQGRLWSVRCTDIQSTESNWTLYSILRLFKKAFASCRCAPKQICSPMSDVIFSSCTNNPIGSSGNIPLDLAPSIPSVAILCFAAWLQIQFSCAILFSLLNDALSSWCALIGK